MNLLLTVPHHEDLSGANAFQEKGTPIVRLLLPDHSLEREGIEVTPVTG